MPAKTCLVLHKKSCTKPEVKAAVKHVRESGIDVDVYIPWSRKDLRRFVRQAIEDGAERIVAGGGDVKDAFAVSRIQPLGGVGERVRDGKAYLVVVPAAPPPTSLPPAGGGHG